MSRFHDETRPDSCMCDNCRTGRTAEEAADIDPGYLDPRTQDIIDREYRARLAVKLAKLEEEGGRRLMRRTVLTEGRDRLFDSCKHKGGEPGDFCDACGVYLPVDDEDAEEQEAHVRSFYAEEE